MILQQYRDMVRALPDAGFLNNDSRFADQYVDYLIHTARATVIRAEFAKSNKKAPSWFQEYIPDYSVYAQDDQLLHVKFKIPEIISLDSKESGYGYIGGTECNYQFRIWTDRSVFTSAMHDPMMNPTSGRKANILFEKSRNCELYSKINITDPPKFIGIYAIPTDIPSYNQLKDDYPFDVGMVKDMVNVITRTDMMIITKSAIDRVNQGRIDNATPFPSKP